MRPSMRPTTDVEPIVPQWLTRLGRRLRAMLASRRGKVLLAAVGLGGLMSLLVGFELQTSWSQARVFAALSRAMTFSLSHETAANIASPPGPYDQRLGYTRLPAFTSRLAGRHSCARQSADSLGRGMPLRLRQPGVPVADCDDDRRNLSATQVPQKVWWTISSWRGGVSRSAYSGWSA